MELRDLIVTPFILLVVYVGAYAIRPYVTDPVNRRYFISALTVRIIGALAMGFIYQYYYGGGDTFNYHTYGSRVVWEAFVDNPLQGLRLIFGTTHSHHDIYEYSSKIPFFQDPNSYFVVRIAAIFDLLTFSSYSATAVMFAVMSFVGMWMLFLTFYRQYPDLHLGIAVATFFIPTSFFWGSGILKDTVIIACLGIATFHFYNVFIRRKLSFWSVAILIPALYIIYSVRVFVLQAYLPAVILWIIASNYSSVRSTFIKIMAVPVVTAVLIGSIYFAVINIASDDKKYSVSNLARTSRITAYDIGFFTGREAGSRYALEIEDWTPLGMLKSAPAAINVSLFRPYLWEARNPLMFISAMESTMLLLFTIYVVIRKVRAPFSRWFNFNVLFCFAFALAFAFAVGISTFNFGTLSRYRILLLPFFLLGLILLNSYSNRPRKLAELESSE